MAILHTPSKHARFFEPDPIDKTPHGAEQEHKDSCDINKMIKNVQRGLDIRGSGPQQYGYDDTTMDALTLRIQKQQLEEELKRAQNIEFTEEEIKHIPEQVQKKFKFKTKKSGGPDSSNGTNDKRNQTGVHATNDDSNNEQQHAKSKQNPVPSQQPPTENL